MHAQDWPFISRTLLYIYWLSQCERRSIALSVHNSVDQRTRAAMTDSNMGKYVCIYRVNRNGMNASAIANYNYFMS